MLTCQTQGNRRGQASCFGWWVSESRKVRRTKRWVNWLLCKHRSSFVVVVVVVAVVAVVVAVVAAVVVVMVVGISK